MHIVYVTPEFVTEKKAGGLASYLANISMIMRQNGHDVTIVTLSDHSNDGVIWNQIYVERVYFKRKFSLVPANVLLQSFELKRRVEVINKRKKIDIIQYASFEAVGFFVEHRIPSCVRISSDPVYWRILKQYDYDKSDLEHFSFTEGLEFRAERRISNVFGPSYAVGNIVGKRIGCDVRVIESPFLLESVDEDIEIYQNQLANKKYYLSHSSMSCLKGTHTIAEAIGELMRQDPTALVVFAGADHGIMYRNGKTITCKEYLQKKAGKNQDRLIFLGVLDREKLYPIIRNAYACLLPSRMDNMPNTCIEAMAMGKIVIGTYGASYDQLIDNGENGFLIQPDDVGQLLDSVRKLNHLTETEYIKMGQSATETTKRFAPKVVYENMISYYDHVIKHFQRNLKYIY